MDNQTVNTKKSHGTKKAETADKVRRQLEVIVTKIDGQLETENWIDEVRASNRNKRAMFKKNKKDKK